jgi:hypothetical protein
MGVVAALFGDLPPDVDCIRSRAHPVLTAQCNLRTCKRVGARRRAGAGRTRFDVVVIAAFAATAMRELALLTGSRCPVSAGRRTLDCDGAEPGTHPRISLPQLSFD